MNVHTYARSIHKKVDTDPGWGNSGASSTNALTSGEGYVMVVADSTSGTRMFGLSNGDGDQSPGDIDFALEMRDGGDGTRGVLEVYEYGVPKLSSGMSAIAQTYARGDILKVGVEYDKGLGRNVVKWYRNGDVLYTSTEPRLDYPLVVDTSLYSPGSWIHDAYLCSSGSGSDGKPVAGPGGPGAGPGTGGNGSGGKDRGNTGSKPNPTPSPVLSPTPSKPSTKSGGAAPASVNNFDTLIYLHSDHLGSVSVATNGSGQVVSRQEYDPWGKVRSGGIGETKLNYTGQKLDGTGLLYYGARYYDPGLARFTSADTVVQGSSSLMVGFHEMNTGSEEGGHGGASNPQGLNRYAYVLNNPLLYNDPSGHKAKPNYYNLLALTYQHMMKTVGAIGNPDPKFKQIQDLNGIASDCFGCGGLRGINSTLAGFLAGKLWADMVCEDCAWDMKSYLSKALLGKDHKSPADDIWFHLPGTDANLETNFNLFGNIWYGFVGAAAGFGMGTLMTAAGLVDYWNYGLSGVNAPDIAAVEVGYLLWEKYGFDLKVEDLSKAILTLSSIGMTHTRRKQGNTAE